MAFDAFLKIDSIPGESKDSKHKDEIEVFSFSWGESNPAILSAGGTGASSGKVSMQDFHFVAATQKSSPALFLACATGEHIKEATLTLRKSGGEQVEYLKYKLTDLLVSSFGIGGAQDAGPSVPTESFSLNFAKIEVEYAQQNADGSLSTPVKAGYDLALQKKAPC
jgi:type VI secretion system secreted protein Hcp